MKYLLDYFVYVAIVFYSKKNPIKVKHFYNSDTFNMLGDMPPGHDAQLWNISDLRMGIINPPQPSEIENSKQLLWNSESLLIKLVSYNGV